MYSAIEKVLKDEQKQQVEYPFLGTKASGLVVFFLEEDEGFVVVPDDFYPIGYFTTEWKMEEFTMLPQSEQVILRNETF